MDKEDDTMRIETVWLGRGGQGIVTATYVVANAEFAIVTYGSVEGVEGLVGSQPDIHHRAEGRL